MCEDERVKSVTSSESPSHPACSSFSSFLFSSVLCSDLADSATAKDKYLHLSSGAAFTDEAVKKKRKRGIWERRREGGVLINVSA